MSIITKHPGVNWSIRNKSLSFGLKAAIHLQGEFPDTYTALTRFNPLWNAYDDVLGDAVSSKK